MTKELRQHDTALYQIRFQGAIDEAWVEYLGLELSVQVNQADPKSRVTTLTGRMSDQAALIGLLNSLYDLGLPLLDVQYLE